MQALACAARPTAHHTLYPFAQGGILDTSQPAPCFSTLRVETSVGSRGAIVTEASSNTKEESVAWLTTTRNCNERIFKINEARSSAFGA